MLVDFEGFGRFVFPLLFSLIVKKMVILCLVLDGYDGNPDGMIQTYFMLMLDSHGARVGKGTRGGEPPPPNMDAPKFHVY